VDHNGFEECAIASELDRLSIEIFINNMNNRIASNKLTFLLEIRCSGLMNEKP
jgi:hypothetical protein